MLFTSIPFVYFLLSVFVLYWFVFNRNLKSQNLFLLLSSYVFYGWWDWRFLFLLFLISVSNYFVGINIQKNDQQKQRKLFFLAGVAINIGTLLFFKYFNFFIDGFNSLVSLFGLKINLLTLKIILPIGISFYIFLSLSYLIDVYRRKLVAVRNLADALLTLSFFPIILAGPIQRPMSLLPQIQTKRMFIYAQAVDGLKQILWGAFMKIVIADRCAVTASTIFTNSSIYSSSTLLLGLFMFTIQIYADFAGYSNMAIGVGKLLGFNIMRNFAYPYFARDIREFWQRWNISLTTWFRDYVFLPIAYSVSGIIKSDRLFFIKTEYLIYTVGITVTWMLTGLWHGANYTFIIWGLIQGLFLLIHHVAAKPRRRLLKRLHVRNDSAPLAILDYFATFVVVMFSWIFFRADNVEHAWAYVSGIFSPSILRLPLFAGRVGALITLILVFAFLSIEWLGRKHEYGIAGLGLRWPKPARWAMYYAFILAIFYFSGKDQQFIYFQF